MRTYQADVWRLCVHLLGDASAADDATQEAFVRAFRFLPRYRGEARFATWLLVIARNCALDEIRRSARRRRAAEAAETRPDAVSAHPELGIEVREAVTALPLELREPVVLVDVLGRSHADVAHTLGVPVGTVKSRVHRARQHLAESLSDHEERSDEA